MRLLVTGTGRCGTGWMAAALSAAGLDCGHEHAFTATTHGDGGWQAEASWLAAPYLPAQKGTYMVHLVRHPLKVIASRAATPTFRPRLSGHGRFAVEHAPAILESSDRVGRSARHWVAWTRLIEDACPDEVLRLEEVTVADVTRLARLVDPTTEAKSLPSPANWARRPRPRVAWRHLARIPGLVEAAARYGYREAA